jgi:hypothetical protein
LCAALLQLRDGLCTVKHARNSTSVTRQGHGEVASASAATRTTETPVARASKPLTPMRDDLRSQIGMR